MVSSRLLPRLSASDDDAADLRATAVALEREILSEYEEFLYRQQRRIDRSKWKFTRSEGDLHAYVELRHAVDELGFMSTAPAGSETSPLGPQASLAAKTPVARMLVTGTVPGSLDDALYGCSFRDTVTLRTKEAYQRDFLDDSAVLLTLDGPTIEDPYRFLGITWHLRSALLSKTRDCLLLQHTHLTTLSTGEPVGVSVRHSTRHRDYPEVSTTRVVLSSVMIFRQSDVGSLEVFAMELLDEKRRGLDAVQRHESARDLWAAASVCDSGFKKKLHWLMRRRHRERKEALQRARASLDNASDCALCTTSTSGLFSPSGVSCQLCGKHVCSRCTMTQDIVVDAATSQAVAKPFGFCIECILATKKLPTRELARDDVLDAMDMTAKRSSGSPRSSDGERWCL